MVNQLNHKSFIWNQSIKANNEKGNFPFEEKFKELLVGSHMTLFCMEVTVYEGVCVTSVFFHRNYG